MGDNGGPNLLALQNTPVNAREPPMRHDVLRSTSQVPQSFRAIGGEEASDQILRIRINMTWEGDFVGDDLWRTFVRNAKPKHRGIDFTFSYIPNGWSSKKGWLG